jgi:hypothetical protein
VSHIKHDVVGSPMLDKGAQLVFQIFRLLTGKAGYRKVAVIALGRYAVTIFALADFGLHIAGKTDSMWCADRAD